MLLLHTFLLLCSLLHQTLGEDDAPVVSDVLPETKKEILDKINEIRRSVMPTASNMLKITWTEDAAETAKKWAENCVLQTSPKDSRTINGTVCGENLSQSRVPMKWSDIISLWEESKSNFEYGVGTTNPKKSFLPYSQLVWYSVHKVGCSVAYCPSSTSPFMYICHFCPGGNIADEIKTPYKKGSPCGDCPKNCEDKLCTNPCTYYDLTPNCNEILKVFTCETKLGQQCEASCKCKTEIK